MTPTQYQARQIIKSKIDNVVNAMAVLKFDLQNARQGGGIDDIEYERLMTAIEYRVSSILDRK